MTYSAGGLIQATDYNGFIVNNANANIYDVWNGSIYTNDKGWGQSAPSYANAGSIITATQWAYLVNTISSMASHTGTTITSRTAPTTGSTIQILSNLNTDLTNITSNRNNAAAIGSQFTGWTGTNSKTSTTSGSPWTLTFTNTVTFASAAAARYFFNAGGLIKLDVSKTSTGNLGDPEWNDLANTLCGDIYISGATAAHTIAGTSYTGVTKIGGTGTPNILATQYGYYGLPNNSFTTIYKQFADTAPYTNNYIMHNFAKNVDGSVLTFTTYWYAADGDPISGGTAASGATPGTAPTTICTYFPPSTTYLSASWGTPTISASVT